MFRRRCSGTAGAGQNGTMCRAPVDLTGQPVKTLPKHLGDIREPHPVHCHSTTVRRVNSHISERTVDGASHCALNLRAINRWTESDALDPMLEKPRKAQVVRIKDEAISLATTSIAPPLDGPFLALNCLVVEDRGTTRSRHWAEPEADIETD